MVADWSDIALGIPQPTQAAPIQAPDWSDMALNPKLVPKSQDTRQPSGLTLFMDPSKFGAVGAGMRDTFPQPSFIPPTMNPLAQDAQGQQLQSDAAANPGYALAGKIGATGLMGGLGAEGNTLAKGLISASKAAGLAEASQGGAALGQQMTPGSPIGPILGSLAAPLSATAAISGIKNAGRSIAQSIAPNSPEAQQVIGLGQKYNIPVDLADITQSRGLMNLRSMAEKIPFSGMLNADTEKQAAIKNAGMDISQQSQALSPPELGDPVGQIQQAVQKTLQQNKEQAGKIYTAAANAAPETDKVKLPNMQAAADSMVSTFGKNSDLVSQPSWLNSIDKFSNAKPRTYGDLMDLRKQITANQGEAGFGTPEAMAWKTLKTGLDSDAEAFSSQPKYANSDFQNAQTAARLYYRDNVAPFKNSALGKVAQGNVNLDTLVTNWVKPNQPRAIDALMGNMDSQGQNALINQVIQKGFGKANLSADTAPYSAKAFANYWNGLGTSKDALFRNNPDMKAQIDGYVKLINKINPPVGNPQTGHQIGSWEAAGKLGGLAVAGNMAHGPVGAITLPLGAVATGKGLTSMLTQPWGQRLLLTAAKTNDAGLLTRLAQSAAMQLRNNSMNPGVVSAAARMQPPVNAVPQPQ